MVERVTPDEIRFSLKSNLLRRRITNEALALAHRSPPAPWGVSGYGS